MNRKTFFQKHSVLIYFFLAFLIAWLGSFLAVGSKFLRGEVMDIKDIGLMAIPMLGAPFVAGILMTYLADGRDGLSDLFLHMRKWRVGGRWYVPLLIFPILLLFVSIVLSVTVSAELAPGFFIIGIVMGPIAGFIEETGWMGFAFPRMSMKGSILSNSISLGIVHGVWHIFADYLGNFNTLGGYWLPYFIGFFIHVVALRVLIVWVYANTKSLFLAILMHASSTGFYAFFISTSTSPENRAIFFIVYGIVLCLSAAAVSLKYGSTMKA